MNPLGYLDSVVNYEIYSELAGDYLLVKAEASSIADSKKLIEKTVETFGKIDILFLNAGIAPPTPTTDITAEHYYEIFDINVKGPILAVKEALPHLNDGGTILFTTSIVHQKGFEGLSVCPLKDCPFGKVNDIANVMTMHFFYFCIGEL